MCGRFARFSSIQKFADLFGTGAGFNLNPRYNVAPTQALLLARNAVWGNRELVSLHWGLIPHWSKEPKTSYSSGDQNHFRSTDREAVGRAGPGQGGRYR
jgi:putative SOS response-associated peptidase YedK